MFFRQSNLSKRQRNSALFLRASMALQVLVAFSMVPPALALDSVPAPEQAIDQAVEKTEAVAEKVADDSQSQEASEESGENVAAVTSQTESSTESDKTALDNDASKESSKTEALQESTETAVEPSTAADNASQVSDNSDKEDQAGENVSEAQTDVKSEENSGKSSEKSIEEISEKVSEEKTKISEVPATEKEESAAAAEAADSTAATETTESAAAAEATESTTSTDATESAAAAEATESTTATATTETTETAESAAAEEDDDLAFLQEGFVEKDEDAEVIYIDNDEMAIVQETIAYEDLPTDEAQTKINAGAQFPVVMVSNISSKTAKKGDVMQARLKYDLKIGPKLIAKKGSMVTGHIDYALKARTVLHSMVSPTRWYRNSGCLGIMFDEIINEKGEHIALNAKPARKDRIVKNKAEGRLLGVNHDGQITGPWGQQLKYKAIRVGLNAALAPAGVFSFGAMPVALGVMGAVNPSFAFMKPVGTNVPHRRIKGFCWGFLSGIPGSWIIEDTVTKGQEALVRPGDEFLVELHQEFTGKVLTEAQLLPGASGKVSGDVDDERLEKTEKRGLFKWRKGKDEAESKSKSKSTK